MSDQGNQLNLTGALKRFRVMAFVSGVMSLLLWFIYVPIGQFASLDLKEKFILIPLVHGYTYPFYVFTALHLSVKARYSLKKMIIFILAGTLPVASFIAERRAVKEHM
jgi:integral membrane protein